MPRFVAFSQSIYTYHPSYPGNHRLLTLHASDDGGLYYDVAYYACCVVAGNIWTQYQGKDPEQKEHPFLSESRDRSEPRATDNILRAKRYYFHVPKYAPDEPFPVIASFRHWQYPLATKLPHPWRGIPEEPLDVRRLGGDTYVVKIHDEPCRFTVEPTYVELGYVVP
ncbi:hypothetical protein GGR54DRAFT_626968 [Hypoxylon sp. NC1633]|nr:hypothetical protein GGR54DRAFT_626968 [Hypoxylon sp. NC1633]